MTDNKRASPRERNEDCIYAAIKYRYGPRRKGKRKNVIALIFVE